jgi:hypothetical protein
MPRRDPACMRIITRRRCPAEAAGCVSAGVGVVLTPSGATVMRIIVLSFAIAFCLGGCHKAQEAATEAAIETASGHKVDVERDGDKVTYKSDEGEVTMQHGMDLSLPADFPKDIYLPKTYTVNSVMDMGGMHMVALMAPEPVPALFNAASEAMQQQGWKQVTAMQQATGSAMLAFEKEKRHVALSFNRNRQGVGTVVSVQMQDDAKR